MTKILFLTRLYKPHVGGVEKHVEEISKILSKTHNIVIVAEQDNPDEPLTENYPEAQVFRIPLDHSSEKHKKITIWKWWWKHLHLLSTADIIHVHDVFFWILPFRFLFPRKKFFITFHGYEGASEPGFRQILWHKVGELLSAGNICIGDFHKNWYGTKPSLVSYGAVTAPKNISQTKSSGIMYLGRLANDTGIMAYLTAAKNLGLNIDIYGDGPLRSEAERISKFHHIKAKFFGFVSNASRFIPKYEVIYTSRYLGIMEALAAKVPVIAHYDSQIKHDYLALAPFAEYIDICSSSGEISVATKRALSTPHAYQRQLDAGYNWVSKQTWAKLSSQYENLWGQHH